MKNISFLVLQTKHEFIASHIWIFKLGMFGQICQAEAEN